MTKYHIHSVWLVLMLGLLFSEVRAQSVMAGPVSHISYTQNGRDLSQSMPIKVDSASKVWLEGSANIINFECVAGLIDSEGTITGLDTTSVHPGGHGQVVLEVRIPVQQLNCGKSAINRDMRNTLNSKEYPYIIYKLGANRLLDIKPQGEDVVFNIETFGELIISGVERTERIIVKGQFIGDWRFRVSGVHTVEMSDYNLTPPSPMLGLIKVHDELKVHFDVILTLRDLITNEK